MANIVSSYLNILYRKYNKTYHDIKIGDVITVLKVPGSIVRPYLIPGNSYVVTDIVECGRNTSCKRGCVSKGRSIKVDASALLKDVQERHSKKAATCGVYFADKNGREFKWVT